MKTPIAATLASLCVLAVSSTASATNYTLWVHGYSPLRTTNAGTYNDFAYFGPSSRSAGVNKRAVSWDGQKDIATTNDFVRNALDCYCTGSNWCYLAGHSTGDMQIAYTLSLYGGTTRNKKNPDTGSAGTRGACTNLAGNATQTGWNIKWITNSGGAAGGSELAPIGHWFDQNTQEIINLNHQILVDLNPARARTFFNHNETRGKTFYMFAGAKGTIDSGLLPGQDDQVVAYHSSGAVSGDVRKWCNPYDPVDALLCYGGLTQGTSAADGWWFNGDQAKWSNHSVYFRDDAEKYSHLPWSTALNLQDWGEIISLQRSYMVSYAL